MAELDPAIVAALAGGDLADATALTIRGAASLAGLERARRLVTLTVVASDVRALDVVASLPDLRELRVLACPIDDATALPRAPGLETVELDFTFLTELGALAKLPALRRARLLGARLDERAFTEIRPRLLWGDLRPPLRPSIELGTQVAWHHTRTPAGREPYPFSTAVLDGCRAVTVRPGRTPDGEVDRVVGSPIDISGAHAYQMTADELYARLAEVTTERGGLADFDFASHRRFGDRDAALTWIDAAAAELERDAEHLRTFVRRFPDAVFAREDDFVHAAWARVERVAMPDAVSRVRRVLAGAWLDEIATFELDGFAGRSPRDDSVRERRYTPTRPAWQGDSFATMRPDPKQPFVVADDRDSGTSQLSVPRKKKAVVNERSPRDRGGSYPVFASVAEMLAHVTALVLDDGTRC